MEGCKKWAEDGVVEEGEIEKWDGLVLKICQHLC